MPTQFDEVYDFFLAKITDFSFASFTETELEEEFEKYLRSACTKFHLAENRLQKNMQFKEFDNNLTDLEIEIVALLMVVEYLNPKIIATENMKQFLASKEFKIYSQANHLQKMIELKESVRREAQQLITAYTYKAGLGGFD